MSSSPSRPPIPRPTTRQSSAPPAPPPSTPSSVRELPKAYASAPPVIRDRAPSADQLADDDLVEEPIRNSTPPPLVKKPSSAPPPPSPSPADNEPISTIVTKREPRASQPDPLDVLFDGLYEMEFADTPWQAADVCAVTLARAVGARAVVVHAHDLVRRELRAIGVFGPKSHDVLGTIEPSEDDFVASTAICNQKPLTMRFDGELPRLAPERLGILGAQRSLVAVPVLAWGRCVALLEIVDADEAVVERVGDAAAYVAERLAEFLSARAAA